MFDKLCIDVNLQENQQQDNSYMEIIKNSSLNQSKNHLTKTPNEELKAN